MNIHNFLLMNIDKIVDIFNRIPLKNLVFSKNGQIKLTNHGLNLITKLYPIIRTMIRKAIHWEALLPNIETKKYDVWAIKQELYKFLISNNERI